MLHKKRDEGLLMRKFFWLMGSFIFLPLTAIADEGTDTSAVTQTTESIEAVVSTETIDSTVSTTETSTVETTQSSEEVTTQPEEVVEAIVAQTGVPASDEAEDITEQSDIRASFTKGIEDGSVTAFTQAELDQLTDQQLKDAETLALRYSYDVMGMDIGYFARIVRALFIDHLVSWEAIEPQLAFDPNSFSTFAAMIPELEQLQTYLQVLYPVDGIYFSMNQSVSDEWLTSILSHLDQVVAGIDSDSLFPGRIGWIIHAINQGDFVPSIPAESSENTTAPSESNTEQSESASQVEKETATSDSRSMPKTGATTNWLLPIVGVVLVGGVGWFIWSKNKK